MVLNTLYTSNTCQVTLTLMASVSEQGTMSLFLYRHSRFYHNVECIYVCSQWAVMKNFDPPKMIPRETNIWGSFCSPACCEMYSMATDNSAVSCSPIHQSPLVQKVSGWQLCHVSKVTLCGFNCMASSQRLAEFCSTPTSLFPEHYAYLFALNMNPFVIAMLPSL